MKRINPRPSPVVVRCQSAERAVKKGKKGGCRKRQEKVRRRRK
jgi:hypothetical protein